MDMAGKPNTASTQETTSLEQLFSRPEVLETLSNLGIFVRNFQDGSAYPNYLWRTWGYTDEELTEKMWESIVHPDDKAEALAGYNRLLTGEVSTYRMTYRVRTRSNDWRWVVTAGRVVSRGPDGSPRLYIGADVDITDRRSVEAALERARSEAEEQAQEAEALRMAGAIVASTLEIERAVPLVLDQAQNVVPYDTATVQLTREDALEVIGGSGWEDMEPIVGLRIPYPGDNPHSRAIATQKTVVIADVESEFPSFANQWGTEIRSWLGVPLIVHGEVIGLLAMDSTTPNSFTMKHQRMAAALGDHVALALFNARLFEQMRELAMTDSLTGVATRRSFFETGQRVTERAIQDETPISVLMADLDHFKRVNDDYGHQAGDDAIRLAADAAREVLRRSDMIGRYGGEEFAVILPETAEADAFLIAERLRTRVSEIVVPGTKRSMSISVGVTTVIPDKTMTIDRILDMADQALLTAKREGRNRVETFPSARSDA